MHLNVYLFHTYTHYILSFWPMCATWPAHLIFLDFISEWHLLRIKKPWGSSLWIFFRSSVTPHFYAQICSWDPQPTLFLW
jgi:hypothetical protein